ncbi:Phosphotransferase enzyme family protein [Marininema mesophilum]|uniref:Phosphotransferase enzyme family protein n=1 Tax=Marininema mesophilum TaxID=1048340 RepID=A0A1H2TAM1_9BACL|nr:aminoglycoside phosphotransferase family protein [Marininema mesophilum]SDW40996.1 Phosphotransferase enzyme family protein [Marininema mesophilum]
MQGTLSKVGRWVADSLGCSPDNIRLSPLNGATSSWLYRVSKRGQESGGLGWVLRLFTNESWLREQPDLALREEEALKQATSLPINTPKFIANDPTGVICGFSAILMTELPGYVQLKPRDEKKWLTELAKTLATIHQSMELTSFPWKYDPWFDPAQPSSFSWSRHSIEWDRLSSILAERKQGTLTFIHRDFHPANVLWEGEKVSGVVDWVNACLGPAEADVAHCRLNLALLRGIDAAESFLRAYQQEAGISYDPWWDMNGMASWFEEPPRVYKGWPAFGVHDLTGEIVQERAEHFLEVTLGKMVHRIEP